MQILIHIQYIGYLDNSTNWLRGHEGFLFCRQTVQIWYMMFVDLFHITCSVYEFETFIVLCNTSDGRRLKLHNNASICSQAWLPGLLS